MIDMGSFDGGVAAVDSSGGAFDSSNGGFGSDVGVSIGGMSGNNNNVDLGALDQALNSGQIEFTTGDAVAIGSVGAVIAAGLTSGASLQSIGWSLAAVFGIDYSTGAAYAGAVGTAMDHLAHDMNLGLGIAQMGTPGFGMMATEVASMGITMAVGDDGSVAFTAGNRMYGIASPNGTWDVMGYPL